MHNRSLDLLTYVFEHTFEEDTLTFTCRVCSDRTGFGLAADDIEIRTALWYHLLSAHMLVPPARDAKEG